MLHRISIDELKAMARNGPERATLNHPCGANYVIRLQKGRLRLGKEILILSPI